MGGGGDEGWGWDGDGDGDGDDSRKDGRFLGRVGESVLTHSEE